LRMDADQDRSQLWLGMEQRPLDGFGDAVARLGG